MSLPPALLQRLAQRGLIQNQKESDSNINHVQPPAENEEVIAEDYDDVDNEHDSQPQEEYQQPSPYEQNDRGPKQRTEENFWLERMKARMGEASTWAGYKGCPNKYNIYHKCTLFCVNRWSEGRPEPSREYMRRYKRLLRKYPLPKGWTEVYDPGCACYYFCNMSDNVVSWLPPTHPKSQVSKSAAAYRKQLEEGEGGLPSDGDDDEQGDDDSESEEIRQREIMNIINSSMRTRSPPPVLSPRNFPSLQEATGANSRGNRGRSVSPPRKHKSRRDGGHKSRYYDD